MSDEDDLPSYFTLAKNVSRLSNCNTKVGAVVVNKKPLIASANKRTTHPKFVTGEDYRNSIHAEMMCCLHLSSDQTDGANIFVYREVRDRPHGKLHPAMAKPCKYCLIALKEMGIKRIYYTISDYPYWEWERLY